MVVKEQKQVSVVESLVTISDSATISLPPIKNSAITYRFWGFAPGSVLINTVYVCIHIYGKLKPILLTLRDIEGDGEISSNLEFYVQIL